MNRLRDMVIAASAAVAGVLFAAIFAMNVVQIFARAISGGWIWVGDLNQLLFAWMIMLGAAAAYGRVDHITADLFAERLPRIGRAILAYAMRFVELAIGIVLLVSGMQVAATRMNIPYIQLGVPTGLTFYAIPALGILMLFFGLTSLPGTLTLREPKTGPEGVTT